MRIGSLVLKRFRKKSRTRKAAPKRVRRHKARGIFEALELAPRSETRALVALSPSAAPPIPFAAAGGGGHAVTPTPAAAPPLQVEPVVVERESAHPRQSSAPHSSALHSEVGGALRASELVRPGDQLRSSIEGFILDQRSPHTQRAYGKDLQRFVKFLIARGAQRTLERIDRSLLVAYKDQLLTEGLEHTSIDRHLATLRSFFQWLVDDGLISRSPADGVRFLNPKRISRTNGFTDDEVRKLLTRPNLHTRIGALHYAALMVLFYCGLRRSEACALRTSSIGLERGHRVLRLRGKGNTERVIPLIPPVWHAIKHYFLITGKDLLKDQYLFTPIRNNRTGEKSKPLDTSMIFYIVTKYAREAGIANRVSPHSCRATAISNARDHNVPDRAIQEFAGWASPDMITRYDKRKSAIEKSAAHAIEYGASDRGGDFSAAFESRRAKESEDEVASPAPPPS